MQVNLETIQTVAYQVASVDVPCILINALPDGKISVVAPYNWLGSSGNTIRVGVHRYSDAEVATMLGEDYGPFKTAMTGLIPDGSPRSINVCLDQPITAMTVSVVGGVAGHTHILEPALEASLSQQGLSLTALRELVQQATLAILEG